MENLDKTTAQRLVQARTGRALEEHLRELYVDRRLTDQEIAEMLDVARSTIRGWRRQFGIDRADRKAALA